ncbi:hypothetical protein CHIBA101_1102 [Actinomyces sp. Chiba101]|uniref:DUF7455 domain-containing protein n=1 Tax=Actinomyces denticolens TaxID=52767 RepID=A0ABY1I4I6_9ACTO|nr:MULTISPECIES: hypothetical protein [Actinomyces]BAW92967.1 hypothetical protein CHIBA101_1102 [Actinomyces sp. Chiba101]GAV94049.1 hypothetical protein ADENT20671_0817 [Actinomyces denticolens]SHI59291.1 hypothetical protein SAMN05216246_10385 [Actinomyces denticolens]SUU05907.1 Uncharacterised protein [Actinomyces denticolens]
MSTTSTSVIERAASAEAAPLNEDVAVETRPLTSADRCDACGAQAWMRVVLVSGELLFCAHHGREHSRALAGRALFIQDESSRLAEGA